MAQDIAVFVGVSGRTISVDEQGVWKIYRKQPSGWQEIRELSIHVDKTAGLVKLRQQLAEIITFLADCRIVVAAVVKGIPFFEFEKAACNVWEFAGFPQDFLDYILDKEQEIKEQQADSVETLPLPLPENLGNGQFRISIKEIQSRNNTITSKQVLQNFLQRGRFYSLDVLCSHIPPWLEGELLLGKYQVVAEQRNPQEIKLTIVNSCCSDQPLV
jgi:Fe-only nitrogenase accessory protein AnfO